MRTDINKLLKKKGWTGKEVGKVLILSLVNDLTNKKNADYKPLFSQADFDKMYNSISSDKEWDDYEQLWHIQNMIIASYNEGQSVYQQFCNGYYRYFLYLSHCYEAERDKKNEALTPYVMTQAMYDEMSVKIIEAKKTIKESLSSLMYGTLEYNFWVEDIPEINKALEATKSEIVTDEDVLEDYALGNDMYYYELPTGERSDQLTDEEWLEALRKAVNAEITAFISEIKDKLPTESAELTAEQYAVYNLIGKIKLYHKFFWDGDVDEIIKKSNTNFTTEEAREILEELINNMECFSATDAMLNEAWVTLLELEKKYYPAPNDITKYDVLENNLIYYKCDDSTLADSFADHYPELYKALEKYVKTAIPGAKKVKAEAYNEPFITWGELEEIGFSICDGYIVTHPEDMACMFDDFATKDRIRTSGVAIYKGEKDKLHYPKKVNYSTLIAENTETLGEPFFFVDQLIRPSLQYIFAFNELMKIIADVYDLPELYQINIDTEDYFKKVEACNELLYKYYFEVYGDAEEKQSKRERIKQNFKPIETADLVPTPKAVEAVKSKLIKAGYSRDFRMYMNRYIILINDLYTGGE